MDVRTLRYFAIVVEAGSFSRAAERLRIAQPALSLQVRKLEAELGVDLLHRTAKGIIPTDLGTKLLQHSRSILRQLEIAREDIRGQAAEPIGRVAVGLSQSMAVALTISIVRKVLGACPRIALHVTEASTGYIPEWLRTGQLDLGLTFRSERGQGVLYYPLVDEELFFVGPAGALSGVTTSARQHQAIRFAEIRNYPLILPAHMHSLRELIEGYARRCGVALNVRAEVDAMPQLRDLAISGIGYTILSYPSVRSDIAAGRLSGARLVDPAVERTVFLCRSRRTPASKAVRTVEDIIRDSAAAMVADGSWPARLPQRHGAKLRSRVQVRV